MKTKHTQGEWVVDESYLDGFITKATGEMNIICDMWDMDTEEGKANAKLIAAAPELLDACINSFKTLTAIGCTMEAEIMQQLESAIKKATE